MPNVALGRVTPGQVYEQAAVVNHYRGFDKIFPKEQRILNELFVDVSGKSILDIGCGAGRLSREFARRGMEVTGIDLAPQLIALAKKKVPNATFKIMDAAHMPFSERSFDVVAFPFNGLDDLYPRSERLRVVRHIYTLVKPGGFFVYSSHNAACFLTLRKSRLQNLVRNIATGRAFFSYYRCDLDSIVGRHCIYYESPLRQRRQLYQIGFVNVRLFSDFSPFLDVLVRDAWPYYVAYRPA